MISLKEYKKLRELLHGSDEDYEVGCENIKNMETTSVEKMMFAKSLMFGRRQVFCEKFKLNSHDIKEWNQMFKELDATLGIRTEQKIIEWEVHQQMLPVFKKTWGFIKDIEIKLDWDHEKPIEPISEEDMGELEKMINNE